MPAATTRAEPNVQAQDGRPDRNRPRPRPPENPAAPHEPASLDAAQNAALASLIRRLADVRPDIVAAEPAPGRCGAGSPAPGTRR
ncbi:hypothetical protein [Streptomonospora litoralis]|uniref:Uncharacterized protein n=1 Tax=Streptomonospora litoralis TaxID=2498135 RepID=A0A4P6Q9K7_9ACTN|nr:hypothetical protein [Streptomonospora litoralis]QBI56311.1 hypothetical protein EKD16_22790 [Streptomonospora litoralis]